uniref:Suppressor of cytokine signaling 5 n=1 Tax=Anopheles coluzzii TaxID=1518534 RepID=A0A6E8WB96_ANOCL
MAHKRFLKMFWPFQDCQSTSSSPTAGSSAVASPSAATVGGSTVAATSNNNGSSAKDAEQRPGEATVDDNSSNQTAAAPTTPTSVVSAGSANTASDSSPVATVTVGSASKATANIPPCASSVSCCASNGNSRKSASSTASTLFGSLSFAGRRSRSSNARAGSCCSPTADGCNSPEQQQQQQRSRISWIPGSGQKQHRNGAKNATPSAKAKKSNWPFSLKSSGGGGGSGGSNTGTAAAAAHKQTTKAASGGSVVSTNTAMSSDATAGGSGSVLAGVAGPSLRGSTLIASAKLLKGESDKDDTCVCTAYRKVSESPPPPSSPVPPSAAAAAAGPSGVAAPRPNESVEWLEEAIQGSGLVPLNLHMLGSLRAAGSAGTSAGQPLISLAGPESIPMLPNNGSSSSSSNNNHHHHHHHHAMAAALVADHHPTFFFQPAHHAPAVAAGAPGAAAAAAAGPAALFGTLPLGAGHPPANDVILLADSPVLFDLTSDDFSVEDCDERARIQRELEIREGVDAPPNFHPRRLMSGGTIASGPAANHPIAFIYSRDLVQRGLLMANKLIQPLDAAAAAAAGVCVARSGFGRLRIHSQVDFIHCLVPDLQKITSCSFYWGKMDRYEAERLLEGKPEGTFLLRDSAQEEFLFSVSFRKYNRSLHARIEQFNHKFSFDSRDPGVFTASTVTGLLEHYKDPSCVMFFEPMLTFPLNRNFSFSLQQLCRAVIVSNTTYDGINELTLPKSLKSYLKEYHYRQRVRFRPMDEHLYSNA